MRRDEHIGKRELSSAKYALLTSRRDSSLNTMCAVGMAAAMASSSGVEPIKRGATILWKPVMLLTAWNKFSCGYSSPDPFGQQPWDRRCQRRARQHSVRTAQDRTDRRNCIRCVRVLKRPWPETKRLAEQR